MRPHTSPVALARFLWLFIAWAILAEFTVYGTLYATQTIKVTVAMPAYIVLARQAPAGMVGHGIMQLIVGISLFIGLSPTLFRDRERKKWLRLFAFPLAFVYSLVTAVAFFAATYVKGGQFNGGWISWLLAATFTFVLIIKSPPSKHEVSDSIAQAKARNLRKVSTGVENGGDGV